MASLSMALIAVLPVLARRNNAKTADPKDGPAVASNSYCSRKMEPTNTV